MQSFPAYAPAERKPSSSQFSRKKHYPTAVQSAINVFHVFRRRAAFEIFHGKRHDHFHAGIEVRDHGTENGRAVQPRNGGHLFQVLVLLGEPVLSGRGERACRRRVLRDHLLAAAAVARDRRACERGVLIYYTAFDKRLHERDEPRRVTPRHGNAFRCRYARGARLVEFGKAVFPSRQGAVRGGRVDDRRARTFRQPRRLLRRRVRQAQERDVGGEDRLPSRLRIFPLFFGENYQTYVRTLLQPFGDAQSRRALSSVHENLCHFTNSSTNLICFSTDAAPVPPSDVRLRTHAASEIASYRSSPNSSEKFLYSPSVISSSVLSCFMP